MMSMVAIGMHRKFAQGAINWKRFLHRCSSTVQAFVASVVKDKELIAYNQQYMYNINCIV